MTEEQAKKLREPFPADMIGKLPKPTKKDNPRGKCDECGGYHGLPAVHLDYVGHAATTDRLLQVDPDWTWEPMAHGENGEPLFTNGGLWIWLTVAGTRRPGFGDGATPKEIIGDAIRNAAMRFGVALDLWAKEDLHAEDGDGKPKKGKKKEDSPFKPPKGALPEGERGISQPQFRKIGALYTELKAEEKLTDEEAVAFLEETFGKSSRADLTSKEASSLIEWLLNRQAGLDAVNTTDPDVDIPF